MRLRNIFFTLLLLWAVSLAGMLHAVEIRDAVFKTKDAGKVVFNHAVHMKQNEMANNCRACHDAIFNLKSRKSFSMADMEKGKSCGACHNGKKAFALKECASCHLAKEMSYKVKATGPVKFSHKKHLADNQNCSVCHPKLFAAGPNKTFSMASMEKGKSCGACHNGKQAFGIDQCATCHPVKEVTYKVKETGPTLFSHKTHIEVSRCEGCHPKLYAANHKNSRVSMAAMENGKSCGACHNGKQAFLVKDCAKCHTVRELVFEDKDAGNVKFSHTFHTGAYKCGDCHTGIYQTGRSKQKVSMKEMEKGISCGACHDGKSAFSVGEKCEACHKM